MAASRNHRQNPKDTPVKTGVLLLNLGSPDHPTPASVRRYLKEFLSDPRVLDLPFLGRWLLLHLIILPLRPKKSAQAYARIWTERGSPLVYLTADLTEAVQKQLTVEPVIVRFAMRYGNPSLASALEQFREEGVVRIVAFPLYPQYASSTTGTFLEAPYHLCATFGNVPSLSVVPPFYDHPAYLDTAARLARESLGDPALYDHLLFSFHGLPERHLTKGDYSGSHCLKRPDCCERESRAKAYCYRAQCFHVAKQLALRLGISGNDYTLCFQSRLGRTPWIRPYTDKILGELPKQGVKRLAVLTPSFTADCLETLEEIGIRGKEIFIKNGGESFHLVPSLNAHPAWVKTVITMIRELAPEQRGPLPKIPQRSETLAP